MDGNRLNDLLNNRFVMTIVLAGGGLTILCLICGLSWIVLQNRYTPQALFPKTALAGILGTTQPTASFTMTGTPQSSSTPV
jgi:hypothetical protein